MLKKAIIITTINSPSKGVKKFSDKSKEFKTIVAGDNKTPKNWALKQATFLSIEAQHRNYPRLAKLVSENHYARKNLAYLEAVKTGIKYIYETDDDNIPNHYFPNFYHQKVKIKKVANPPAFNIYSLFTRQNVWPRGLPLNYIRTKKPHITEKSVMPLIQQSLVDLDPDVDAIYRSVSGKEIRFASHKAYCLATRTYCPFNSQSTYWHKKVFPLLYLPSTVESRVTDIWRGYIAQRVLWELDSELIFLSPCVYQERNPHNLMKDFEQELDLYLKSEELINTLNKISLKGSIEKMLLKIYQKLISSRFFERKEMAILKNWLEMIND